MMLRTLPATVACVILLAGCASAPQYPAVDLDKLRAAKTVAVEVKAINLQLDYPLPSAYTAAIETTITRIGQSTSLAMRARLVERLQARGLQIVEDKNQADAAVSLLLMSQYWFVDYSLPMTTSGEVRDVKLPSVNLSDVSLSVTPKSPSSKSWKSYSLKLKKTRFPIVREDKFDSSAMGLGDDHMQAALAFVEKWMSELWLANLDTPIDEMLAFWPSGSAQGASR